MVGIAFSDCFCPEVCLGRISAQDRIFCYAGLRYAVAIVENGKTRAEHDYILKAALQRTREMDIKLHDEKFDVDQSQDEYYGHLLSADSIKPDPKKVTTIRT